MVEPTIAIMLATSGTTTLDIVTLVIAVLGLLLGTAGLVWQVQSWRYEGARIKVNLDTAFPVYGPRMGDPPLLCHSDQCGAIPCRVDRLGPRVPGRIDYVHPDSPAVLDCAAPHS